jgi:hypothetical protein
MIRLMQLGNNICQRAKDDPIPVIALSAFPYTLITTYGATRDAPTPPAFLLPIIHGGGR